MTETEIQQRLRDTIARTSGLATTRDGMLTWASADLLAEEILPFLEALVRADALER